MASVFRITDGASLALHSMALLAREPDVNRSARDMAAVFAASEHHLAKVLQRLGRAGLVRSVRGPAGGFRLARLATDITLLQIYEVMEGPMDVNHCVFGRPVCSWHACVLGGLFEKVNAEIREYFSRTTLAALLAAEAAACPAACGGT